MSKPRERRVAGAPGADEEWMVGRVSLPVYVAEPEPFRPDMVLCVSQAGELGATTVDPDASDDGAADTVVAFSRAPMVGPPRRPRLIRVGSPGLREALARRLGEGVAITLAATPEIDALAERFVADFQEKPRRSKGAGDGGASYLSGGRIDPELARGLFDAAARLYEAAPWTVVPSDTDVLALDVPSLGAEGLCVSVIGQMGENLGVVVFASRGDFGRFLAATARGAHGAFGAPTLHVGFERLPALPPRMRDEIAKHGWKCVGPSVAPVPI